MHIQWKILTMETFFLVKHRFIKVHNSFTSNSLSTFKDKTIRCLDKIEYIYIQLKYQKNISLYISVWYALNILRSSDDFLSYRTIFFFLPPPSLIALNSYTTSYPKYHIYKAYHNNSSITEVYVYKCNAKVTK